MKAYSPNTRPLKIAIVGTGISGMASAWLLAKSHNVTVFEQNAYIAVSYTHLTLPTILLV